MSEAPVTVTIAADTTPLAQAFARMAEAAARAVEQLTPLTLVLRECQRLYGNRWRDWPPSSERPVDRARRQRVQTAMRRRERRAHRHGRTLQ